MFLQRFFIDMYNMYNTITNKDLLRLRRNYKSLDNVENY